MSGGGILSVTCGSFSKLQLQNPFLCWLSSMPLSGDRASSLLPVLLAVVVRLCLFPLPAWLPDGKGGVSVEPLSSAQGLCGMNEEVLELCEGNTGGAKEVTQRLPMAHGACAPFEC